MRKYPVLLIFLAVVQLNISYAQVSREPVAGGGITDLLDAKDEITPEQRAGIIRMLQENEARLRTEGRLERVLNPSIVSFSWPLKQALGYNDKGYYGITNYVDHNLAYPNLLLDYNCGSRTYDLPSGYNHRGTDIVTWPFGWQKMDRNIIEIIAAAPGTILAKTDGNFDRNCAFCSTPCTWNAVYVMHGDGSVAWYGHMKTGSLTTKLVGETVAPGEYLGIVGSSGNSTIPHLHFEVYTNSTYTQLIDPFAGNCNSLNGQTSWWASQQPYHLPTLLKVMTHAGVPGTGNCPVGETPNEKINFANGEIVYFGSYYRDQQVGQQSIHTVYRPNNTVFTTWPQNFNIYYPISWWSYFITLPNPAAAGTWRYEILYNGTQRQSIYFAVNSASVQICPGNYNTITSNVSGITYQWQVDDGSGFINISDGLNYEGTTARQLLLKNAPSSFYGYQYRCFVNGSIYSNVIGLKFTSYWTGYVSKAWENPSNWTCGNVPDANTDVVIQDNSNTPEVNSNAICRSTTASPGAVIRVKTGYTLTLTH